jgi:hypothetical protein
MLPCWTVVSDPYEFGEESSYLLCRVSADKQSLLLANFTKLPFEGHVRNVRIASLADITFVVAELTSFGTEGRQSSSLHLTVMRSDDAQVLYEGRIGEDSAGGTGLVDAVAWQSKRTREG